MFFGENKILFAKICGMVLFSGVSIIIGLFPMFVQTYFKKKKIGYTVGVEQKVNYKHLISHLSAFGGGVLLSTTFLHLLPEIRESIEHLQDKNIIPFTNILPLAELLMCLGFLFLYLIEELVHNIVERIRQKDEKNCSVGRFMNDIYNGAPSNLSDTNLNWRESNVSSFNKGIHTPKFNSNSSSLQVQNENSTVTGKDNKNGILDDSKQNDAIACHSNDTILFSESSGKNFLLIFALSIHEGFEGLAIGLESELQAVWYMVLGVGAHKAIIAFCIGVQMLSSKLNRKVAVIYIFVFATATSFGVGIGLFLYTGSGIFSIILQGIATGTLLHVVFFELLKPHSEHTPFIGVLIGFFFMAILKYLCHYDD